MYDCEAKSSDMGHMYFIRIKYTILVFLVKYLKFNQIYIKE
jgi:hypothetical protein